MIAPYAIARSDELRGDHAFDLVWSHG